MVDWQQEERGRELHILMLKVERKDVFI